MESLKEAWGLMTHRFWVYVGATAMFMLLAQMVSSGVSMLTGVTSAILSLNTLDHSEKTLASILSLVFSFVITQFVSIVIQTIIYLMQNIVYFTAKEEVYHISGYDEIDEIGKSE
jgi:ABC-type antimicrobial peptide transport system permease subunit